MGGRHAGADIGGTIVKFVLYGRYCPKTCVAVYTAANIKGYDFSFFELDCDPVLIAFSNGREMGRTSDMAGACDWVKGLVLEAGNRVEDTP